MGTLLTFPNILHSAHRNSLPVTPHFKARGTDFLFSLEDNESMVWGKKKTETPFTSLTWCLSPCQAQNLLARWPVAWGGRTLGMIGRDRAALVREDWMGRNEPLPVRTKTEAAASSPLAPVLSDRMAGTTQGWRHSQLGPWKLSRGDTTEHPQNVLTWGSQRSHRPR